jgi:hypothetical protein
LITLHNNLAGLNVGDYLHLTALEYAAMAKAPATNSADYVPQWDGANSKLLKNGLAVGTSANNLVQLNASAQLPAVSGALLTNLPSSGHVIQEEGSSLTQRSKLNFVGQAVTATDDAGNDATKVTINFNDSDAPIASFMKYAGVDVPANYLLCDGASVSRTTYADLWSKLNSNQGAATISNANPAIVTLNGHGRATGDSIFFTTDGALPASLAINTIYYVVY